jgi:transposase
MEETITFVGLDVSKKTISVALALGDPRSAVSYYGSISYSTVALRRLCKKLSGRGVRLHFCYEAGPFGYGLQRRLEGWGHRCEVIAPSLIPRRAGDRVKTDRRDALSLASLLRAGQLTAIWVPDETHEAVRGLVRLRNLAVGDVVRAKQQILSLCLAQDRHYPGKTYWTKTHRRWLVEQTFDHAALSFSYSELLQRLERAETMVIRVRAELRDSLPTWALYPVVEALRALRGFDWETAAIVVAEIGDFSRFASPRQLMAYVGLVPSEASSGETCRRGEVTRMGNAVVRRALIEAAWSYRFPAKLSYKIRQRSAELPEPIRAKAWKAQTRLCGRMRHLHRQGKNDNKALAAVARELTGFVWAIARMVEPKMS